jgi:bacterioferritin-associated ferredoxin
MTTTPARPPIDVELCDKEIEDTIKSLLTEYRELDEMTKEVQFPHHCFNCIIQAKKSMRFAIDNLEMATLALEKFERRQESIARNTRGQSV